MQAKAIFYAMANLAKKGIQVQPEIMIPLVGHVNELKEMRQLVIDAGVTSSRRNRISISSIQLEQ